MTRLADHHFTSSAPVFGIEDEDPFFCPGHIASDHDPKVCRYCGTNVEEPEEIEQ